MNMKFLLFMVSSATFSVWSGTQVINLVDPLPTQVVYWGSVPASAPKMSEIIEAARRYHRLPKGLIEGVIATESNFNALAKNPETKLLGQMSAKGWSKSAAASRGLMGVVYGWHKDACALSAPTDLYDPKINIRCGALVLKQKIALAKGDVRKGLGFYNGDKSGQYAAKVLVKARKYARG